MKILSPEEIIDFWFSEENKPFWFRKDKNFDGKVSKFFLPTYEAANKGKDLKWKNDENDIAHLAKVILLDQIPRNIFRDKREAFNSDEQALKTAKKAIDLKLDKNLPDQQKMFLYMPFMHSENLNDQRLCIALISKMDQEDEQNKLSLDFATQHKMIIVRFGRFPHRNSALKRKSTPEELKFLKEFNSGF